MVKHLLFVINPLKSNTMKPLIYVIEDSFIQAEIIAYNLKNNLDSKVKIFCNGDMALENIYYKKPDVIVLDYYFNNKSLNYPTGLEVLRVLKKNEEFSKIPVIVFSGLKDIDKSFKLLEAGAYDIIDKSEDSIIERLIKKVVESIDFYRNPQIKVLF